MQECRIAYLPNLAVAEEARQRHGAHDVREHTRVVVRSAIQVRAAPKTLEQ